jgi:uroporphyrin-3 C-methyltransferase
VTEGPERPEDDEDATRVRGGPPSADEDAEFAAAVPSEEPASPPSAEPEPEQVLEAAVVDAPTVVVRRGGGRGIAILALLLVLGMLLALTGPVAWLYYRGEDPLDYVRLPAVERLEGRIGELEQELGRAQRSTRDALDREAELRHGMEQLGQAFTALAADLASDSPIDDRQWRIAETAYLLRVANLRAGIEGDRAGAEGLLRAADELLREIDDFGLLPVRERIAEALAELRTAPAVDRTGLYLELEALGEQIDGLPLDRRSFLASPDPEAPADAETDWLTDLRGRFAGLVDFRVHRPAPVRALTSPEETAFLRHNLALKLEQAQLALLRKDATVWRRSLLEARGWMRDHFDLATPEAAALVAALERLEAEAVDVRAPDISAPHSELLRLRGRASFLDPVVAPGGTTP